RITYPNPNPPGPANGNGTALHDLEHDVSIPPSRPARTRRTARADPSPDLDTDLDADTDADADTPRRTRRGRTQRDTFDPDATPHAHPYNSRLDDGMSTPRTLRSHARSRTPEQGQVKERTPELARGGATASTRKRQRVYGDRFIPNREGQDLQASYSLLGDDVGPTTPSRQKKRAPNGEMHFQKVEEANRTYSRVLRHEVFGDSVPQPDYDSSLWPP
ncbi:substrate-specific activator of APC-dependent proteolysis, partial [Ascosphaera atra]